MRYIPVLVGLLLSATTLPAMAAPYVFAVPPRQSREKTEQTYGPVATYLSQVTGHPFQLIFEDNWLSYESDMKTGRFDLVFDGPSFIAWRVRHLHFTPLAKLKGHLVFNVIVNGKDSKIQSPLDLVGRPVCAFPPPNIGTLTLYNLFPNPLDQPRQVPQKSLKEGYQQVVSGGCMATILPTMVYRKLSHGAPPGQTRVIFTSTPIPNQGFSAGPRIPAPVQAEIRKALLSPAGAKATAPMRALFNNRPLVPTQGAEYEGADQLLKSVWGFSS